MKNNVKVRIYNAQDAEWLGVSVNDTVTALYIDASGFAHFLDTEGEPFQCLNYALM